MRLCALQHAMQSCLAMPAWAKHLQLSGSDQGVLLQGYNIKFGKGVRCSNAIGLACLPARVLQDESN